MRLGDFDPVSEQPYKSYGVEMVNTPQAHAVALEYVVSMILYNYMRSLGDMMV